MSDAKKCDRCGEYYDGFRSNRSYVSFSPDGFRPNFGERNYMYDMCPKCKSEFIGWMNTHQKVICMEEG